MADSHTERGAHLATHLWGRGAPGLGRQLLAVKRRKAQEQQVQGLM